MELTIYQPVGFNEAGGRSNNEDSIFPAPGSATLADRLFLVCDGVGGEHKGEVASALACEHLAGYFEQRMGQPVTEELVKQAVSSAHKAFLLAEEGDPETKGMATTMTLLYLHDNGAVLAHLGDSRIYQLRDGKIIYQTKDHKWVNELVESGVITEEQALEHPKRNVITRVITASRLDQPDYIALADVQPEDYFFLCTDGVLEQVYDELLEYHLRDNPDNHPEPAEILEAIRNECADKTRDNFSAYLVRVKTVAGVRPVAGVKPAAADAVVVAPVVNVQAAEPPEDAPVPAKSRSIFLAALVFAVILGLLLVLYFLNDRKEDATTMVVEPAVQKMSAEAPADSTPTPPVVAAAPPAVVLKKGKNDSLKARKAVAAAVPVNSDSLKPKPTKEPAKPADTAVADTPVVATDTILKSQTPLQARPKPVE